MAEEELRRAMLQQMNRRILEAAAREVQQPASGGGRSRGTSGNAWARASPPRYDDPPLHASTEWQHTPTYRVQDDRRAWTKPGMARLVLERLGEVVASGRRSLYGTPIDSPADLFAAMGGGASAVGMAQFRRALRRLDVAASEEAIVATIEMLDPGRCYFRAFDGREFVRILTPFCVTRPPPDPPPLLQSIQAAAAKPQERPAARREDTAGPTRRRFASPSRRQKPVWTWFADGQNSMSSQFIDRSEVLHEPLSSRLRAGGSAEPKVAVSVETVEALMNTLVADARARFDAFAGEAAAAVDAARSPERDRDEVREQLEEMLERDNWVATQRMMQPHHGGDRGGWGTTAAAVPPHPAMFSRRAFRKYMDDDHSDASSETESGYDDSSSESERDRRGSRGRRRQGRHRRRHSSTSEEEEETDPEQGHQQDGRGGEAQTKSATGATAAGTSDTEDGVQAEIVAAQKKVMVLEALKEKLRSMSYTLKGASPVELFQKYDTDGSGELDLAEFTQCIREGGQVSADAMSDAEIRQLFRIIDEDDSGDISIDEVTHLIWGDNAGLTMGSLEAAMAIAKNAVEADSDGQIEEAIKFYAGAAQALRHYGHDTSHAAGYDAKAEEYELRIAELRVALGASAAAPEPEPEPASDELRNPQLNATENDLKKGKKKADKEKVNRSKSKDRSRRRSSSDRRSSSRRRSSGGRKRQNSSTWKGDEDPTARLTDAEWRLMWGLHSQEAPQLVISEEEHRRRLGEALVAASSDAVLRREDVEKRLRSKDDELTQLKVLAAEKDLALQTLQARTQELLERCVAGGGQVHGRDAEIVAALSGDRRRGPDRSVHVDPFVERTYTSQSVAQSESLAGAVYKMQEHLRQSTSGMGMDVVGPEKQQYAQRPAGLWTERGPTMTTGGFFPTKSSTVSSGDGRSGGATASLSYDLKTRPEETRSSGRFHGRDPSVSMETLEESAVPPAGSPDRSVPPSEYSTPSYRVHGWEHSGSDASDDKSSDSRSSSESQRQDLTQVAPEEGHQPGRSPATLPAGLSGEALMAVLQEMDPAWLRQIADTVAQKRQEGARAPGPESRQAEHKSAGEGAGENKGWTDAVAAAAESARKRGSKREGSAGGSSKIAAEFGTVYNAIIGSATDGDQERAGKAAE